MQLFVAIVTALLFVLPNLLFSQTPGGFVAEQVGDSSAGIQQLSKCKVGKPVPTEGKVYGDVDGDTVKVETDLGFFSVRLLGIDTPETHFMGQSQGQWGEVAASRMSALLPAGTNVKLDLAEPACDNHGRILAFIIKGENTNVNLTMVKEGLAVNYCVAPNFKNCVAFGQAVKKAIETRKGMFSDPNIELPYDFRRRVSGAPQRSFVGNIRTKEVYRPGNQDSIAVENRVFFFTEAAVQAPYRVVENP